MLHWRFEPFAIMVPATPDDRTDMLRCFDRFACRSRRCISRPISRASKPRARRSATCRRLRELFYQGVRRYGFHGLSYGYIAQHVPTHYPHHVRGRMLVAHPGKAAPIRERVLAGRAWIGVEIHELRRLQEMRDETGDSMRGGGKPHY